MLNIKAKEKLYRKRLNCRLCDSVNVKLQIKMPQCPPVDNYLLPDDLERDYPGLPMDLYQCIECGHAQLLDIVDHDVLFGNYIYTSSSSPDLDEHFSDYAGWVGKNFSLDDSSFIVDIGGNDGLFLSKFKQPQSKMLLIDPSQIASSIANKRGIPVLKDYFSNEISKFVVEKYGRADFVFANNVFSHMDEMREFAESVKNLLTSNGVFIFEVSYLLSLIKNNVIDYIYHEHLAHHSVKPLRDFMHSVGLKLTHVEEVKTKGGSIRCVAALDTSRHSIGSSIEKFIENELNFGLYKDQTYIDFNLKIDKLVHETHELIENEKVKFIATYGASATSTVLNYLFKLNEKTKFVIDDNADRQGRLSPGFKVPVIGSNDLDPADIPLIVISAWRFANLIVARNTDYLKKGGKFLIPLPTPILIKEK